MAPSLEILLLGTGTSAQTPAISCLTAPPGQGCAACLSTLTAEGKRNIRRNTSVLVQVSQQKQEEEHLANVEPNSSPPSRKTILIDAGKSFCEAAREHFPKNRIRRLDAVLLTHPHADAINGLDDLRAWTLRGAIQPTVDIYCNAYTLKEVEKTYSYLVDTRCATGGGDVPSFQWHVFEDGQTFELFGIRITPIQVYHGYFCGYDESKPYTCTAFMFDRSFLYMADVSEIPESSWSLIEKILDHDQHHKVNGNGVDVDQHHDVNGNGVDVASDNSQAMSTSSLTLAKYRLPLFILDTLSLNSHVSHFSLSQAVMTAKRIRAMKTYLVGFSHRIHHDAWVLACEAISSGQANGISTTVSQPPMNNYADFVKVALMSLHKAEPLLSQTPEHRQQACWIRPGFDGLRLFTDGHTASDDAY